MLAKFAGLAVLGILWLAVSIAPGWIFFVKRYEQRELELRFGTSYIEYRSRAPFWCRLACTRREIKPQTSAHAAK
jgi:protein-S-isoprenylcysteine O-methyltransferase Ste14